MIPINLVLFQMSDFPYEIKETSLPVILNWKYWLWKIRVRAYATNDTQLILILADLVDDEDVEEIVHELILQTSDNVI